MRPKYGVRIPERSHTQRLPQIAVLRDIFSSSFAAIDSSVEHGKRSSRDIIRTTGIFLESNLEFFHNNLNNEFTLLNISLPKI